jgi:hypothetical protein
MQKKHVTQTGSKASGFKWLNLLAGCVVPLAVVAGCNGSDDDGGPSPLPTNTPSATSAPTAAPTPAGRACDFGTGNAVLRTTQQGNFNPAQITNGCGYAMPGESNSAQRAAAFFLEETVAGEKRLFILLVNDPSGLRINRNYKPNTLTYSEQPSPGGKAQAWASQNGVVVIDAITPTSIRYHFQGSFTPGTETNANVSPGTGRFTVTGSSTAILNTN